MLNYIGGSAYRVITSGNTQVRRLAYLTAIASLLPSQSTVSTDQLASWLMKWATEHSENLKDVAEIWQRQGSAFPLVADRSGTSITSYITQIVSPFSSCKEPTSEVPIDRLAGQPVTGVVWAVINVNGCKVTNTNKVRAID
jgi:hypothetical protein